MSGARVRAWIGLGSNLDEPRAQLARAVAAMEAHPELYAVHRSPIYRSPPLIGPGIPLGQPDYLNAVVRLETALEPAELLRLLLELEDAQGRERGRRWAARTLDLDLLLYGTRLVAAPGLIVPHAELAERAFVLRPLADLDPELEVPGHGLLADLLAAVDTDTLERVD